MQHLVCAIFIFQTRSKAPSMHTQFILPNFHLNYKTVNPK